LEIRLQTDLFCVKWDIKRQLSQTLNLGSADDLSSPLDSLLISERLLSTADDDDADNNESVRLVTVCVWRVDMRNTNLALQQLAAANMVNQSSTGSSFASDGESAVVLTVQLPLLVALCLCSPSSDIGRSPLKGCMGNCGPGGK